MATPPTLDLAALARKLVKERQAGRRLRPGRKYAELAPFVDELAQANWTGRDIAAEAMKLPQFKDVSQVGLYDYVCRRIRTRQKRP